MLNKAFEEVREAIEYIENPSNDGFSQLGYLKRLKELGKLIDRAIKKNEGRFNDTGDKL